MAPHEEVRVSEVPKPQEEAQVLSWQILCGPLQATCRLLLPAPFLVPMVTLHPQLPAWTLVRDPGAAQQHRGPSRELPTVLPVAPPQGWSSGPRPRALCLPRACWGTHHGGGWRLSGTPGDSHRAPGGGSGMTLLGLLAACWSQFLLQRLPLTSFDGSGRGEGGEGGETAEPQQR